MALLAADPVEQYTGPFLTDLWTQIYTLPGGGGSNPTVNTTGGRRGGHCLQWADDRGYPLSWTLAPATNDVYLAFAFKVSAGPNGAVGFGQLRTVAGGGNSLNLITANNGVGDILINQICSIRKDYYTQVSLSLNSDGTITAYRGDANSYSSPQTGQDRIDVALGTTTKALQFNQWHFIELYVLSHASAGIVTLRVDEETTGWLTLTGLNTIADGGSVGWDNVALGVLVCAGTSAQLTWEAHDIRITDTDTADQDNDMATFQGDLAVSFTPPQQDGAMLDWTILSGATHFAMVDEIPPDDDTTYNSSSTAGQIDTFVIPGVPFSGGTVVAVGSMFSARRVSSGASSTRPILRIGGTNFEIGAVKGNPSSYVYHQGFVTKKPSDHTVFTEAQYLATQPGYKKES